MFCYDFAMLDVSKSLPEDPAELRAFTALLLAEVKAQAVLIESEERSCASRIEPSSGRIEGMNARSASAGQAPVGGASGSSVWAVVRDRRTAATGLGDDRDRHCRADRKAGIAGGGRRRQAQAQTDPRSHSAHRSRTDPGQHGLRAVRRQAAPPGRRCNRRVGIRPRPLAIVLEPMADNGSMS